MKFNNIDQYSNALDLYCGTGTITSIISKKCKKVIGIEVIEDAVENANKNIKISKNIGKFDKNLIKEINEFIKDNNSNSKFHLMLDEKYYLLEFELNLKDNYDVTIFSNGIDSYNNYYDYEFENGYEIYKKHENVYIFIENNIK